LLAFFERSSIKRFGFVETIVSVELLGPRQQICRRLVGL